MPGSNSTSTPLTLAIAIYLLRRDQAGALHVQAASPVRCNPVFHLVAEVTEQALDRPGGRVAQGADGVTLDLGRDVQQGVDLFRIGLAGRHALHAPPHPAGAFAARRALTAA